MKRKSKVHAWRSGAMAVVALAATTVMIMAHAPAAEAKTCGPRTALVEYLGAKHREKQTAIGLTASGRLMEIFASANGSWTMLLTQANGNACVVATGKAWASVVPEPPSA